jgi:serine protease AprX
VNRPSIARGTRWHRGVAAAAVATASLVAAAPAAAAPPPAHAGGARVVVIESPSAGSAPERAVVRLGGHVDRHFPIVRGFSATVPTRHVKRLRGAFGVRSVHADRPFELRQDEPAAVAASDGVALDQVRAAIGAGDDPAAGEGVDIALVDSGITPVGPLSAPGKVVDAPDFSSDAGDPDLGDVDAFGHGTHLAGAIDGVAPGARLVDVKVAAHDGSTSLSALLAGIDWVVRHGDRRGLDVRVLNLAFGADSEGSYRDDPLAAAVERAWQKGVVVITSAGNGGGETTSLDSPAYDPYVVAVGASDTLGTPEISDDVVADFSSRGSAARSPDVVAPGVGIVSARVPGGYLDELFPNARVGDGGFRGSGTSQSAAVVSGAAALLVQARPGLEPDQVKALLRNTARPLGGDTGLEGRGLIDVAAAAAAPAPAAEQRHRRAVAGRWQGRFAPGLELAVERPDATRWSATRWSATRWSATRWSATRWSATRWSATRWSATRWSATRWSATRWSTSTWGS